MEQESVKYIFFLVGAGITLSAYFWNVISKLKVEIAQLQTSLTTHINNESEVNRKITHIDQSVTQLARDVSTLVGQLQGKGVLNGNQRRKEDAAQ